MKWRLAKITVFGLVALSLLVSSLLLPVNKALAADVPLQWTTPTVPGSNAEWRGIAWSPELGIFVAVADVTASGDASDKIGISTDGVTWQRYPAPSNQLWRSVTWSPQLGIFVAVSIDGTEQVITSPDGINWTPRSIPQNNDWDDVIWSPERGLFVAVAYNSNPASEQIMTSPDGITWTPRATTVDSDRYKVAWSPELGLFAATGGTGTQRILTSPDGITWTPRTTTDQGWYSITWSGELGMFVSFKGDIAAGDSVMTSSDGITWTTHPTPIDGPGINYSSLAWSPELGVFVAVGATGTQRILTSPDGITWTPHTAPVNNSWDNITWSPDLGIFVAVSTSGTDESIMVGAPQAITPNAPTTLQAAAVGSIQINLSWQAATSDNPYSPPTGYRIERSMAGGSFVTVVANTNSTSTTYQDNGLTPGTLYAYRVSAINAAGVSGPSNEASATTLNLNAQTPNTGDPNGELANTGQNFGAHAVLAGMLIVAGLIVLRMNAKS